MNIRWQKMNKCNRFMNIRKNHPVDFAKNSRYYLNFNFEYLRFANLS
jgi:hypothetical protein